jgi:pimeloyl-ACP methyl ester carboxylesterase
VKLHFREYGNYSDQRPTLIFLHGLLGASSNWHSIARKLEDRFHIIVPDLRNHGRSPHAETVNYPVMALDLAELIDDQGLDSALLVGHSMGGKVAMWLALTQPGLVSGLVVVDIAPVNYPNRFESIFVSLSRIDIENLKSRGQAEQTLAFDIGEQGLRQFLLQNLERREGAWRWRSNLSVLNREMHAITGFPEAADSGNYPGPVLFIRGGASDYLKPEFQPRIRALFPHTRFRVIAGAGHWVYAEQPEAFYAALTGFL